MNAVEKNVKQCAHYFQMLDRILGKQDFLAGPRLTLADIPAGTNLYRYFNLDIARPAIPHVEAWYQRLQQSAAFQQHVMIGFKELFGRLDY